MKILSKTSIAIVAGALLASLGLASQGLSQDTPASSAAEAAT